MGPSFAGSGSLDGAPLSVLDTCLPSQPRACCSRKLQVILIRTRLLQVRESLITDKMLFWSPNYEICELQERFLPNTTLGALKRA